MAQTFPIHLDECLCIIYRMMDKISELHFPTSNLLVVFGIFGKSWATGKVDALVAGPVTRPWCSVRVKAESRVHGSISPALRGLGAKIHRVPHVFIVFLPSLLLPVWAPVVELA